MYLGLVDNISDIGAACHALWRVLIIYGILLSANNISGFQGGTYGYL